MKSRLFLAAACILLLEAVSLPLVLRGQGSAIVLPDSPSSVERTAASELSDGLFRISGEKLPVISESGIPKGRKAPFCFFVGATGKAASVRSADQDWAYDEIMVVPVKGGMVITGHPTRGPLYAVNTLLEEGYGVRWWTSTEAFYPSRPILPVPPVEIRFAPPLKYREASILDAYDADFRVRLRGNSVSRIRWATSLPGFIPEEKGGCHRLLFFEGRKSAFHSFFEILPAKKYFGAHPEWYSMIGGERVAKQLCLTNREMEKAFIEETLRLLREHPEVDFLSVSQNDRQGACECDACRAVEEATGGVHSGPLLLFVNRVAEAVEREFPHVTVETFAYQYTVQAPLNVKPRHNVLIRVCNYGGAPISFPIETSDNALSAEFRKNLSDWSQLAPGQVFVWNYVTDFNNYLLPHPNLLAIAPDIRYFAKAGAVGVFEQGDTCSGAGELAPLRLWLIYHMLWNPEADDRALIDEFVRGYYGEAAAPDILRYISLVNEVPLNAGIPVKMRHPDCSGWMLPSTLVAAASALDSAAAAAAQAGEPYASRVRRETLSTHHAVILQWDECRSFCDTWKIPWTWGETRQDAVRTWLDDCEAFGVRTVRETTAEQAPELFRKYSQGLLEQSNGQQK